MSTPIPTPFDIIDPGPGPLLPTGLAWALVLLCAALGLLCIALLRRVPRATSIRGTLRTLLDELQSSITRVDSRQDIERAARIGRRIASAYTSVDVSSLSCAELRSLAATLSQSSDESLKSLSPILLLLSELEDRAYAPMSNTNDLEALQEPLRKLASGLAAHLTRFQPL